MPREFKKREFERVFRKLDMKVDKSTHHVRARLVDDGKVVVLVHMPHGRGTVPGRMAHQMRKAFRLTPVEFNELVSCSMTRDEYLEILRRRIGEESSR